MPITDEDLPTGEAQEMGVFTATTAGTDDEAHELTLPDHATITAGDAFGSMNGFSATGNVDGNLKTRYRLLVAWTLPPRACTC